MTAAVSRPVRIGNAPGFYGDRLSAVREMLTGGELDVLTGDYLSELTMLILGRDRLRDTSLGYARTFLRQLEDGLGLAVERGVRIVSNAGGLNPTGLAAAVRALAVRLGLQVAVGCVTGDDLLPRAAELGFAEPVAANAYLGGWGIAACLQAGADVVITGRVTDTSLVLGPAAAHHGWERTDYDALAGAIVAGHVIEGGPQAAGGDLALFTERPRDLLDTPPGFTIAEVAADGSAVITRHDPTGGVVTVATVTAQLLHQVAGGRYPGPDVTARIDTAQLEQDGPDRVRITGVRGEPPPPQLEVSVSRLGGFRNDVTFVLAGLDLDSKVDLVRAQLARSIPASATAAATWTLARTDRPAAVTGQQASATLRCVLRGPDPAAVGPPLSAAAAELALAGYPGFHLTAPPSDAQPYGVFEAFYVDRAEVSERAELPNGRSYPIGGPPRTQALTPVREPALPPWCPSGGTTRGPLGLLVLLRSGDKGGTANLGVWVRAAPAWPWLVHELTSDRLRELLPETADRPITRHVLGNLHAVNFVIEGLSGVGVTCDARFDPQATALGEWLRCREVDLPTELLP
jgi:hypothetical protein